MDKQNEGIKEPLSEDIPYDMGGLHIATTNGRFCGA